MEVSIHRVNLDVNYIDRDTLLHRMDARIKTLALFILLFSTVLIKHHQILVVFLLSAIIGLWLTGIDLQKLSVPSTIVMTVFLIILLTHGGNDVLLKFWIFKVTEEGLKLALLVLLRVLTSISLLHIYISTTRVHEVLSALHWMRLPRTIVDLMFLMIRFVGILSKDAEKMHLAAKSKHAFSRSLPYIRRIENAGMLAGSLILRAYDRSERVYLGMLTRGFGGDIIHSSSDALKPGDCIYLLAAVILSVLSIYLDRVVL